MDDLKRREKIQIIPRNNGVDFGAVFGIANFGGSAIPL